METKMVKQSGFTIIELMVSIAIGLFLISGVFYVYLNSNQSQKNVESEARLIDAARFALETISYDLKHAGIYGTLNHESSDKIDVPSRVTFNNVTGQCGGVNSGWVTNVDQPVFGVNDTNSSITDCIVSGNYKLGTDIVETRYVTRIDNTQPLISNILYIRSDSNSGVFFKGDTPPVAQSAQATDYQMYAKSYYISDYTNEANDGVPSLHMISLQPGPVVTDTILLEGVAEMQLRYGLTADNKSTSVVTWVNDPGALDPVAWDRVIAARIWLVMQTTTPIFDVDTSTSFEVNGVIKTYPNDGYRRVMVTTAVRLRNMNTGGS